MKEESKAGRNELPGAVAAALRWVLPAELRESVLGDLQEEAAALGERGRGWYWRRALEITEPFARRRIARALTSRGGVQTPAGQRKGDSSMQTLWWNLRQAGRMMRKNPGFTAVAVTVLALGIGANTAIFSVINAVLLRPLPFSNPDQLVRVYERNLRLNFPYFSVSPTNYTDWAAQATSFEQMAAYRPFTFALTGHGEPERIIGSRVSAHLFPMLGFKPLYGRLFLPEEDQQGRNLVVILSEALWRRRFGADPAAVGRNVTFNGQSYTIVGVLPGDKFFPNRASEAWAPIAFNQQEQTQARGAHYISVIGRLKRDVTPQQAHAEMQNIARRIGEQDPKVKDWDTVIETARDSIVGDVRTPLNVLLGAVGLVLLIACANVANLLLTRATARRREMAVQTALGASRGRIIGQLLTESMLLAVTGGAAGVGLAHLCIIAARTVGPAMGVPLWQEIRLDAAVLLFTLGITLLVGLLFGMAPAMATVRGNLQESLKEGARGMAGGRSRLRSVLVASEVALSLVLLIGAGLFIRSFAALRGVDPGMGTDNLLVFRALLPQVNYPDFPKQEAFFTAALEKLRALPGVESAAAISILPLSGQDESYSFYSETMGQIGPSDQPSAQYAIVSPDYFHTVGMRLMAGRVFDERDNLNSPRVAIINDEIARRYFKDADPIGKRVQIGRNFSAVREIVGVVSSVKRYGLNDESALQVYEPYRQVPQGAMNFVLRAQAPASSLGGALREAVWSLDRNVPINRIFTMREVVEGSMAQPRFRTVLLGIFAGVALLLAAVGLYGVMAYNVTQRTHEIGLRMALGAQRGDVLGLVLRQGMLMALLGVVAGVGGALALGRAMSQMMAQMLFGVQPLDPVTYVAIPGVLLAVALLACLIPAQRATRVDPLQALRYE